jgi:Tol biopolymer transport system component
MTVFPPENPPVNLAVPTGRGITQYSRDGTSLYASYNNVDTGRWEIEKVDIRTGHTAKWLEMPGFTRVFSFAVARDESRVIVSGQFQGDGVLTCGVFEIQRAGGDIPRVLIRETDATCDGTSWFDISLSTDGKRAVAWEGRRLVVDLIDLDSGALRSIGRGAFASWSPDGKWIAMLDAAPKHDHVLLLEADDPSRRRDLGTTDGFTIAWSPDSRYLLLWNMGVRCLITGFGYWGSLEVVDVQSGERSVIDSSRCKVNNSTGGWVSNAVWR